MKYRENFKKIFAKFPAGEEVTEISSDEKLSVILKRFHRDPRITKHIQPLELAYFLGRYDDWDAPEQKMCRQFLHKLHNWAKFWIRVSGGARPLSGNFNLLGQFAKTVKIYTDILAAADHLTAEICFQKSIQLATLLDGQFIRTQMRQAAGSNSGEVSKNAIQKAWNHIILFLDHIKRGSHTDPTGYFEKISRCKPIVFDAAFVWDHDMATGFYNGKSVEKCILWLDFSYNIKKEYFDLISINNPASYEDREITEMIRTAINEAADCYHRITANNNVSDNVAVHNAFFQIGEQEEEYDGQSIGCAVFCAALCLFMKRSLPSEVFYTGKAGTELSVEGVYDKALAGQEKGFTKFIIPADNDMPDLHGKDIRLEIFPYRDMKCLADILLDLIDNPHSFLEILRGSYNAIYQSFAEITDHAYRNDNKKTREPSIINLSKIGEFWKNKELEDGKYASVEGTLSKYAPLSIGYPKDKVFLHRAYRRDIIPKERFQKSKTEADANLAYTSGQMVWKLADDANSPWVFLGLYGCIVRNSIAVFVERNHYNEVVQEQFDMGVNPYVIKAKVTGRLGRIPDNFLKEFIERNKFNIEITPDVIERSNEDPFVMIVDEDPNTSIEYSGVSQYLDGDVWLSAEIGGKQSFISRFLDIADYDDLQEEIQNLKNDAEGHNVLFQFDEVKGLS